MSNPLLDAIRIDTPPPSEEYLRKKLGELYESPRSWQQDFRTGGSWRKECPSCNQMFAGDMSRLVCRECYEQEEQKEQEYLRSVHGTLYDNPKNWQRDFVYENGTYENKCSTCESIFVGHKSRHVCRECYEKGERKEQP